MCLMHTSRQPMDPPPASFQRRYRILVLAASQLPSFLPRPWSRGLDLSSSPHLPSTSNCTPMNPVPVRSATRTQRANVQPVEHPLEISLSRCAHLLQSRDGGEAWRRDKMRCSDEGTDIACVPWEHGEAHLHPVSICISIGICIPVRHHQTEVLPPPRVHPSSGMSWVTGRPSTVDSSRLINLQLGGDCPYARRKLQVPFPPQGNCTSYSVPS